MSTQTLAGEIEGLHEEARQRAGLDDFGDPAYREALGVLLDSLERDADLSPGGADLMRGQLVNTLVNRLQSREQLKQMRVPDGRLPRIQRPIIITGLVRTGSTALHYLMGQDPNLQSLEYWLAAHPRPRPPREDWSSNADFLSAEAELEFLYEHAPGLMAVHEMRADWPEECRHLLEQSFVDDRFEVAAAVGTYAEWYHHTPHREAYRLHQELVQLIGSTDPDRRWLLKYPVHLRQLPCLLEVYPDACIVQTHRDPVDVIASYTSFISRIRALHENHVDTTALAQELTESWADAAEAGMAARRAHDDQGQFLDVHFSDFVADPLDTVRTISAHFDHDLTEAAEERLRAWHGEHPQGSHGGHHYDADAMGITESEIRDRFSAYLEHFGM
jgi:hypothetical protein